MHRVVQAPRRPVTRKATLARRSLLRGEVTWAYLFVAPAVLGFVVWTAGPMLYSAWLALTQWELFTPPEFVGLANFHEMFLDDQDFWHSLRVTLYYSVVGVPLNLVAGFAMALLLNARVRGISIFRTVYYLPSVVPTVANSVLWLWVLNYQYGLVNSALVHLGLPRVDWLGEPQFVLPALWMMGLWGVGGAMVIYLAGLQGIPQVLYEAAQIDGANAWAQFRYVTVPQMSAVTFFNLIMGVIGSFQVFTASYVMFVGGTGGPERAALFYVLKLWSHAFRYLEMGYASAMAWVLFVIILALTGILFRVLGTRVYYEGLGG